MNKTINAPPKTGERFTRAVRFLSTSPKAKVDEATRTITFSFSSEKPVERWFGDEILSHDSSAADLTRLNDGAPLLFNHNFDDVLGVVESAQIGADRRGYCTVRFAKTPRGDEMVGLINDGVLRNVSFAYQVDQYVPADDADGDGDCFLATRWMAYEISFVAVPADQSIGVGRAHQPRNKHINYFGENTMNTEIENETMSRSQKRGAAAGAQAERERIQEITAICSKYNVDGNYMRQMIDGGTSVTDARAFVYEREMSRPKATPIAWNASGSNLDMTEREIGQFSIVKAVRAQASRDWKGAGFELECSRAVAQKLGKETAGFYVPEDVQNRGEWQARAPYAVGASATGGALVQTQLLASSFADVLRNASQVANAGAQFIGGLVGNADIPRRTGATNTYWVNESAPVTEAESTFDKITLRPRTLGAFSKMSRLTLLQATPDIEILTQADIAAQLGLGIDLAAISGSGAAGQPLGIVGQAGVQNLALGTNGAAISFDNLIQMETLLAASNAPWDTRTYLMNAATVGSLKKIKATTGSYLWTSMQDGLRTGTPPQFNGYRSLVSNQLRSNLTKGTSTGVCSEVIFGAFSELVIGQWGVLEILVNPFDATGFPSGDVLIRALQTVDIQLRHGASFAVISDALTP